MYYDAHKICRGRGRRTSWETVVPMLFKTRIEIIPQRILEKKDRPKFNIRCVPTMQRKGGGPYCRE